MEHTLQESPILPDTLEDLMESADKEHAERMAHFAQFRGVYTSIINDVEPRVNHISLSHNCINISLSGTSEDLVALLRRFYRHGFVMERKPEANTPTFSTYLYPRNTRWHEERPGLGLYFSSTVCRRVSRGKEMREVEVFETVCGDSVPDLEQFV